MFARRCVNAGRAISSGDGFAFVLFYIDGGGAGHEDVVSLLLRRYRRLKIDQCNNLGFTALMKAAIQGRTRCAKLLLSAGQSAL